MRAMMALGVVVAGLGAGAALADASSAMKALQKEPKIKDVSYQPNAAVQWVVGVISNGTAQHGYASYVCQVLAESKATTDRTVVRIVDIAKVANGEANARQASLGSVRCKDHSRMTP